MSSRRWLPTVIRARQAQEDQLAQQVATARRDVQTAIERLAELTERVAELQLPARSTIIEFHTEIANQQVCLANLAAATHRVEFADARLRSELTKLTEAARSRRMVEKMQERIEHEQAVEFLAVSQREQDEVAIARHARAAG